MIFWEYEELFLYVYWCAGEKTEGKMKEKEKEKKTELRLGGKNPDGTEEVN